MHAILADIGNSSTKLVIVDRERYEVDGDHVIRVDSDLSSESTTRFHRVLAETPPTHCYVSSVNASHLQVFQKLVKAALPGVVCQVLKGEDVRLKSDVESRQKLGIDRLLAAQAGVALSAEQSEEQKPVIVVDAGTAVTIDLVDCQVFKGGVIFPGAETSFHSLHRSTGDLPDLNEQLKQVNLDLTIGNSTESAILTGVLSAQAFAIRGIVDRIAKTLDTEPFVVASGGGIESVCQLLPKEWHFTRNLVLQGIASVAMDLNRDSQS